MVIRRRRLTAGMLASCVSLIACGKLVAIDGTQLNGVDRQLDPSGNPDASSPDIADVAPANLDRCVAYYDAIAERGHACEFEPGGGPYLGEARTDFVAYCHALQRLPGSRFGAFLDACVGALRSKPKGCVLPASLAACVVSNGMLPGGSPCNSNNVFGGYQCASGSCISGRACGQCANNGGLGQLCSSSSPCGENLVCLAGECQPKLISREGQACTGRTALGDETCDVGLLCNITDPDFEGSGNGTCVKQPTRGEPCIQGVCARGLGCLEGYCRPGQVDGGDCSVLKCGEGLRCNRAARCVRPIPAKVGEACDLLFGQRCDSQLNCERDICVAVDSPQEGAPCTEKYSCGNRKTCVNGTCQFPNAQTCN
jgi:hypothetical protein